VKSGDAEKVILEPMTLDVGSPFSVAALPGCSDGAHVVQFEVSALISGLINVDFQGDSLDDENLPNGFSKWVALSQGRETVPLSHGRGTVPLSQGEGQSLQARRQGQSL
jgi:hypothetical protein